MDLLSMYSDGFTAKAVETNDELNQARYGSFAGMGSLHLEWIAEKLGLDEMDTGEVMAYCFRRFGLPINGWDDYKTLCCWIVKTPVEGVFLTITPRDGEVFGFLMNNDSDNRLCAENKSRGFWGQDHNENTFDNLPDDSFIKVLYKALWRTMADLFRPVPVRDWCLYINGEEPEIDLYDEDEEGEVLYNYNVEPHHTAGKGLLQLIHEANNKPDSSSQ